jgi:hypothetical protein
MVLSLPFTLAYLLAQSFTKLTKRGAEEAWPLGLLPTFLLCLFRHVVELRDGFGQ